MYYVCLATVTHLYIHFIIELRVFYVDCRTSIDMNHRTTTTKGKCCRFGHLAFLILTHTVQHGEKIKTNKLSSLWSSNWIMIWMTCVLFQKVIPDDSEIALFEYGYSSHKLIYTLKKKSFHTEIHLCLQTRIRKCL